MFRHCRLRSGDLGYVSPDGHTSRGELVMPEEIEDVVSTQPGVSQADAPRGELDHSVTGGVVHGDAR